MEPSSCNARRTGRIRATLQQAVRRGFRQRQHHFICLITDAASVEDVVFGPRLSTADGAESSGVTYSSILRNRLVYHARLKLAIILGG